MVGFRDLVGVDIAPVWKKPAVKTIPKCFALEQIAFKTKYLKDPILSSDNPALRLESL